MRNFSDDQGNNWQAALMEASYGIIMLVFCRVGADDTRQTTLNAQNRREAEQILGDAHESTLRTWLAEATPWEK